MRRKHVFRVVRAGERADARLVLLLHHAVARLVRLARRHRDCGVVPEVGVEHRAHALAPDALERVQEALDLALRVQVPEELAERGRVAHRRRHAVRRAALCGHMRFGQNSSLGEGGREMRTGKGWAASPRISSRPLS